MRSSTAPSIASSPKPLRASQRAVAIPPPRRGGERLRPLVLGHERRERRADQVVGECLPLEVGADRLVAPSALREGPRAALSEAGIVHDPGALEQLQRLGALPRRDRAPCEPRLERTAVRGRGGGARPWPRTSASCLRSSPRRARRRARSSCSPTASPTRTTTSAGSTRQGAPSSSTATRPGRLERSAVTSATDALRGGRFDLLGFGLRLFLGRRCVGGPVAGLGDHGGKQARRDDLLGADLGLDPREDLLADVGVLAQERGRVLTALPEPLVAEAEVRAGLLHDLPLERGVEDGALPRDPGAVDDVELRLLERRRDLVLDHLHAHAVAERLDAFLERLDAPDVEPHRRVELQRAAARGRLRVAEHDADLLAQLVREDADRVGAVERARQLAQGLAHQARLQAHVAVAHLALDLRLRRQRRDRVDGDDVHRTRADQQLGDLERLLAGVGLGDEQLVDVDPDLLRVGRVHRVLGVDERADAAAALRLGDHVVDERRLARRLGAEDLDDAAARQPADPEREVERERAGRDRADGHGGPVAHPHHGALAELPLDLAERDVECLLAIHVVQPPSATDSMTAYCAPLGRSTE